MAEIQQNQKQGSSKRKKTSTRIDMTAMVDVAFLLLTFFILTTSLATPYAMELNTPPEGGITDINCKKMMTIYLTAEDQIHYVAGCDQDNIVPTDFSKKGIRVDLIREKQTRNDLIISIKPSPECSYGNVVDILDEIKISGAPKYALAPWTDADDEFLKAKGILK